MKLFQVVGRKAPTDTDPNPPAYRMKLFANNEFLAKSRFWYFMHQMRKMKKTTGEILDVNEITEKSTRYVKNYGIWVKYNSRSGIHNMYREYRDTNLNNAISTLCT
jgi:large subunit ribosomal protein L18Ae